MIVNSPPYIIPITEYATIMAEVQYWKDKYFDLKREVYNHDSRKSISIQIKDHGIIKNIKLKEIIMIEAAKNYCYIHFVDGKSILSAKTLKAWIEKIGSDSDFIRIHRTYFVNKNHINSYQLNPRQITLTNHRQIPVARRFNLNTLNNFQL